MVTDVSDYRPAPAKVPGADFVVNTKDHDFGRAPVQNFGPDKADVMYDLRGKR